MPCLFSVSRSSIDATKPRKNSADDISMPPASIASEAEVTEGESGLEAWCTVLGSFLAQFCGFGYTSAFGVYQAFYAQNYLASESSSAISWIGSVSVFLVTGVGFMCGPLFDQGYFYHVFIGGAVMQSFSIFMLSLANPGSYYQILLTQGLGSGISQGLMYVPSFAVLSHHFKRRRTAVMSIAASGSPLGGIAHTIMLNKLLNGSVGFKAGVRMSAALVTILLFFSCLLMRARYGTTQKTTSVNFWQPAKKCLTEVPSLLTILGFTCFQTGYLYPFFYFQVDSLRHGLSTSFSFYSLVIINVGSFIGRFTAGLVTPFTGIINLTIITIVVCAVLIVGMIWLSTAASVVVLGVLYGIFSGMNIAMMPPMLALTSDPAELGVRMGVGLAITGIGGLLGSPICGALLTSRYIWWAPALFCGAIALGGGFLFVALRVVFLRAASKAENAVKEIAE
ncbi:MFS general substrate transporter [Gyrodon lividus]|nr:MFS general substrate transporter [Gyrodon lividus]